jgi:hypothetical protein
VTATWSIPDECQAGGEKNATGERVVGHPADEAGGGDGTDCDGDSVRGQRERVVRVDVGRHARQQPREFEPDRQFHLPDGLVKAATAGGLEADELGDDRVAEAGAQAERDVRLEDERERSDGEVPILIGEREQLVAGRVAEGAAESHQRVAE